NFGIDEFVNPRLRTATGSSRKVKMRVGFTPVARKPLDGDRRSQNGDHRKHSSKEPRT
ncbi:ABC transporter permease, partial [Streptomyces sp. SID8455]|nr:ABC transporter permease [Streptomyces sp. SID8455]